jgi:GcrA cell cycle regulator
MSWTDERVETLKKMWGEGQSASQIAKELGGVTRNAVIGKVHRLGLSNRAGSATAAPAKAAAKEKPAVKAAPAAPKPAPKPKATTGTTAAPAAAPKKKDGEEEVLELDENGIPISAARRAIIPAGQPLPPQPSANEISPEALAKVSEVEKVIDELCSSCINGERL